MALLRECLQALRTKQREWDVPTGAWPEPKLGVASSRRDGTSALPLRRSAADAQRRPVA